MNISSRLFEAYLYCSTKCWLQSRDEPASGNIYEQWAGARKEAYYAEGLKRAFATFPENTRAINPPVSKLSTATLQFAIDVPLRIN